MKMFLKSFVVLAAAATLVACGGGGGDSAPTTVAASDLSVAATAGNVPAVTGTQFAFPGGVSSFGTTAATNVTFTGTAAAPTFAVASGGATATGNLGFGSCIFTVTQSTFAASSPLATGKTVTVNPCNINVGARGVPANSQAVQSSVALLLGTAASAGVPVTISINAGGQLTINGNSVGTVTLAPVTAVTGS
jgi:hypothetical protein